LELKNRVKHYPQVNNPASPGLDSRDYVMVSTIIVPSGQSLPEYPTALLRAGRPLKRWRYVGVFCEELMACAALVRVGPARQSFWAVYPRAERSSSGGRLRERTRMFPRGGTVELVPGRMRVRDGGVLLDIALVEDEGVQARCTHGSGEAQARAKAPWGGKALGGGEVWTRKQAGVRAHGTLSLDGGPSWSVEALAVIDDTAGYHARHTEWWWSAGIGASVDGLALAWNLVQGINDPPSGSERAVWIDGKPSETAPVRFAADLSEIIAADGSRLSFAAEAIRQRRENLLIVSSDYTAPFGTFAGTLPGAVRLRSGLGVMEHHRAKW
jgi:Protein of unknown function (DUF2804)